MAENLDQTLSDEGHSFLEEELEALRSIYINETDVYKESETTVVSIDLHPATAANLQKQYVKLTLKLTLKNEYPNVIPEITIRNPRGLSDEKLSSISDDLQKIAKDKKGSSMLFEIIEAAKDHLTAGNRPCEECAICLYGFESDDIFTKTDCYHYFHSHCLARYAKNCFKNKDDKSDEVESENLLLCPVCRLPIHFDGINESYPPPMKDDAEFSVTDTILETQMKMQELYVKQVEKGGIIDLEAEKNKYLIEISHVPSVLDTASEKKSEDESNLKVSEDKDCGKGTLPSSGEYVKKEKSETRSTSNRISSDRRYVKHNEGRRGNEDQRNERYRHNRGNDRYRKDSKYGRNDYDRRYEDYYDRYDGYGGSNRGGGKRNNWHDNRGNSNRYEKRDRYNDRGSQKYGENSKGYRNNQDESYEDVAKDKVYGEDSNEVDPKKEINNEDIQDSQVDSSRNSKNYMFGGDRRNYQENRYDRRNVRYDHDRRHGRYGDGRNGGYDRRNDRFDNRKNFMHNGLNKNENYSSGRGNRSYNGRNRDYNPENEANENEESKCSEEGTEFKERENWSESPEAADEGIDLSCEPISGGKHLCKSEGAYALESQGETKSPRYTSDRTRSVSTKDTGDRQAGDKNYQKRYQRPNSNRGRYNAYSKQSNPYQSHRGPPRSQNMQRGPDDEGESSPLKSNTAVVEGCGEPEAGEDNIEESPCDPEDSGDFADAQHSKKSSVRSDSGNTTHYKNYREGRPGHGNRYQNSNRNYNDSRPFKSNPRFRNNHADSSHYSDRTSNGSKRYPPKKYANDSNAQTMNDADVQPEIKPKANVDEPAPVDKPCKKPVEVPAQSSDIKNSVPTSNFLPPMSSVAPPPGFQNPSKKIVYGLAAANPPPGFNRS